MTTYEELREKFKVAEAQLRARCEHLEAGLKVIARGDAAQIESVADGDVEISAIEAFAQSTLDEAPASGEAPDASLFRRAFEGMQVAAGGGACTEEQAQAIHDAKSMLGGRFAPDPNDPGPNGKG